MYLFKRTALFAGVIFILSACSGSTQTQDTSVPTNRIPKTTTTSPAFRLSELKSAEDRWRTSNISDYQFTISYYCFMACGFGPERVTVKNDQVTSVFPIDVQDSASNRRIPPFALYAALDLFKLIRRHIEDFEFSVTYDKKTGFPLSFYSGSEESWHDDKFGFQTEDFKLMS